MNQKCISISLYNRPEYTKQVFKHLKYCRGIENYLLVIRIDPCGGKIQEEIIELVKSIDFAKVNWKLNRLRMDCNGNIHQCLKNSFAKGFNWVLMVEDDICISKDALEYFEYVAKKFEKDLTVFSADGFNRESAEEKDYFTILRSKNFRPWGWLVWKDRWEEIKDKWQFKYNYKKENGEWIKGGWDLIMKNVLRKNRYRIYPKLSRVLNVGREKGRHILPHEHDIKHPKIIWANNFNIEDSWNHINVTLVK